MADDQRHDIAELYSKLTIGKMRRDFPNFNWLEFFNVVFKSVFCHFHLQMNKFNFSCSYLFIKNLKFKRAFEKKSNISEAKHLRSSGNAVKAPVALTRCGEMILVIFTSKTSLDEKAKPQ